MQELPYIVNPTIRIVWSMMWQ